MISRRNILCAVLIASLVVCISGCGQKETAQDVVPLVKVTHVGTSSNDAEGTYSGTVRGRYESNLSFQAGGRIISRNVQLGSVVHTGDVLMTIDPKDVIQAVNQSQATVTSAQAQLALATSNLARYQQLFSQDAVSAAVLDQYQTSYEQAQAQYDQAVASQQAQQNQLGYTQLTADADGVVSAVNGEVGQVVASGQTVLTLVHSSDLEVQINVPENQVQQFPIGKAVDISFWALQNQQAYGVVREVAPMADAASRTYKVCVTVQNPPEGMQLGMTSSVKNVTEDMTSAGSYVLPLSAIYQTGDKPQVWVVNTDNTLSLKDVSVETFGDDKVKVSGLSNGDIVVTAGVHMLTEGETVRMESDTP
ncbi:MAG: efflux RND transporter periplasmic adaptor subunit [Megasphaera sp.]|jgi:RND family efflux transporter MFP subunit|nr:efflux RND transporter periplasmic adaptor subunit [Megasphaera sp.]MCH4187399.1 efflux RND transporter periplasmic adaptor subunit [Megasphaera sp.]MCH4217318.1 efflux RND transporter periplasmic adaptor subunit [Megasphaera sp.]